jgi:hypothetical protein
LSGIYLTDNPENPTKWEFPAGTIIKASSYLTIWADEDGKITEGLHANFKLSADGEQIRLLNGDGSVVDEVSFGAQSADVSTGRCANGSGAFVTMVPTYGKVNVCTTATEDTVQDQDWTIVPNPAISGFVIKSRKAIASMCIYDLRGRKILETNSGMLSESLKPGMYIVEINKGEARLKLVQQ